MRAKMRASALFAWLCLALLCRLEVRGITETWMGMNYRDRTKARPELQWDWGHAFSGIEVRGLPAELCA